MKTIILFWKSTLKTNVFIYCLLALLMAGCSKNDAPEVKTLPEEIIKSSAKQITRFVFQASDNPFDIQVEAIINEQNKTITATLQSDTPLTDLTPVLSISEKASINITGAQDFTNPVTYTVTAEDGTASSYTATATSNSSANQITSFVFLLTNNPIAVNIVATIDEENKTITAAMPPGTDLSGLLPEVQLSEQATVDLTAAQNFTGPLEYTVTAEDGSTTVYTVTITVLLTQRQILQTILDANPGKLSSWDLQNTADLDALAGVTTNTEGQIIKLRLDDSLISIPTEIGQLTNLEDLNVGENQLTSIPKEIGQLTNLTRLHLGDNQLSTLPPELGFLTKLNSLFVNQNNITTIPQAICNLMEFNSPQLLISADGNLTCSATSQKDALISIYSANPGNTLGWSVDNFAGVDFYENGNPKAIIINNKNLTRIPDNMGQLTALETLNVDGNNLTSLPTSLGKMSVLSVISANNNNLSTVPSAIGSLDNLSILSLLENPITSLPQEVCDLQRSNGGLLTISTDPGEGCGL